MTTRVHTPRRVYLSVSELARQLDAKPQTLYRYLVPVAGGWRLRPLCRDTYAAWHQRVWRREVGA